MVHSYESASLPQHRGRNPFEDALDRILAEIAFSVQLPPSLHAKACQRYRSSARKASSMDSSKYRHVGG